MRKIKKLSIFVIFALSSLVCKADVLWKPSDISYEIKKAQELLGIGYMLELTQKLSEGEIGWKQSRFDIPESWSKAKIEMSDSRIIIKIAEKSYFIDASNFGTLKFEILNAGKISDAELEGIWTKHASSTKPCAEKDANN